MEVYIVARKASALCERLPMASLIPGMRFSDSSRLSTGTSGGLWLERNLARGPDSWLAGLQSLSAGSEKIHARPPEVGHVGRHVCQLCWTSPRTLTDKGSAR